MPYRRCRSWKDKGEGRLGRNIANMTIRTITSHLILLHYLDWKVIIFFKVYMMYNILTKVSDIKYSVTFNFKKVLNNSICPSRSNIAKTTLSKNSYFFSPPPPFNKSDKNWDPWNTYFAAILTSSPFSLRMTLRSRRRRLGHWERQTGLFFFHRTVCKTRIRINLLTLRLV